MIYPTKKIKDIGTVVTGKTPLTAREDYYNGQYMFITPTELHGNYIVTSSEKTITEAGLSSIKTNSISGESILVGCIGWDMGNVAMCFEKCATNQQINSITKIKNGCIPVYLYYWLKTKKDYLFSIASVTRTPILSKSVFEDVDVPLPDVEIQRNVANVLQRLDEKIELNERINDNLQQMAKTIYDYWFTQFEFPNADGKPYRSSGGKMVWNDELKREIPEDWSVKSLFDVLIKNTEPFDYLSSQPAIDLSVMPSDSISLSQLNTSDNFATNLYKMQKGDILFGSIRPYLHKAGFSPCDGVVAGTVHSYRVRKTQDYNFALFTLCRNSFFDYAVNISSGTKMPVVSSDSILAYKVPYNESVVKAFNNIVPVVDIMANNVQEIQQLVALRDWLLPMLMNGQATIAD